RIDDFYSDLYESLRLADVVERPVEAVIFTEQNRGLGGSGGRVRTNAEEPLVDILKTGVLKVGYHALEMPYCYKNKYGELVGYDVAYAHQLARDLDCTIEFIPLTYGHLKEEIDEGLYDIAMSSIIMSEHRIINMSFTSPYDEQNYVLVVPILESKNFLHLNSVIERKGLKIGGARVFLDVMNRHFPLAELVIATVSEQIDLLMQGKIDAIIWERVPAFIWSLRNPDYIVIDYEGLIGKGYLSYAFHANSPKFGAFLNNWLLLKKISGFQEKMHNYWFEGIK
ncbi:MAG TPA: ABC transporter substrate-binding protein, partial [Chlamydiales bacterium]|nr:ABC transporter substrate-binding protein [Chlamydiales bacterium]